VNGLRRVAKKAGPLICFGLGLVTAVALAGCGGGENVAATGSTTRSGVSLTRTAPTHSTPEAAATVTRPAATSTQTPTVATVTQTNPAVTVTETQPSATVSHTATAAVTVSSATSQTTTAATESGDTPAWVWVLVAVGGGLLLALLVWLLRRKGAPDRRLAERQRLISASVAGWTAQGWAIETQTESTAVMRQDGQRILVTVEADGRVTSRPLANPADDR